MPRELKLEKMEKLIRQDDGQLLLCDEVDKEKNGNNMDTDNRPFKGISSSVKKLKNNESLDDDEKKALINCIDEFTTVSTNENVVGADVSRIVLEVNLLFF